MTINILFIGDIIGQPGLNIVQLYLPSLIKKYNADVVIANGENAADGKGCTEKEAKFLFDLGVHVITGGNHTWDKPQSQDYLKKDTRALRPFNYPRGTHGNGYYIFENEWQSFRTKKNNDIELTSTKHEYTEKGKYKIMVKVVDILGIDTSQVVEVEIK